jgi:radical SAM superfamily enzyme YgiQ (UPF0313 family)
MADYGPFFATQAHRLQQANLYWPRTPQVSENPTWPAAPFRALIVRLSSFRDVDRSTPHLFLADAVRRAAPDAFVDFAFFPPPRDRALLREHAVPWLTGIFSHRSAEDFDVVLVSNAYTLELFNLPALLLGSGIPPWARDRAGRWPPFILGGSNALASQAILDADGGSFVDALFFGEGEEQVEKLIRQLSAHVGAAKPCRDVSPQSFATPTDNGPLPTAITDHRYSNSLVGGVSNPASPTEPTHNAGLQTPSAKTTVINPDWAKDIPGLWPTGRWPEQPVQKATVKSPGAAPLPRRLPLLNSGEAGTARLQINYGCPAFCTFCFEGYDRKPYREVAATALLAAARALKHTSGAEALELFSFNFNTHAELLTLLPELNRVFDRVNMMSQRVDLLATAPELLPAERAAGKRSFTLGIEGISTRLRAMLHKSLPTADIQAVLRRLLHEQIRELKLFYLLTGDETDADLAEFIGFCRELRALGRVGQAGLRVMFSFGLLIRMPFTPLRHDRLRLDEAAWQPLLRTVQEAVKNAGFEFRLAMTWPDYATTQLLALAPAGLAPALLEIAQDGFCYDQSLPAGIERRLRTWMQAHGLWTEAWLGEKPAGYPFALAFVRSNVTPKFLFKQFQAARREEDGGFCLGGACLACGACATTAERKRQTGHRLHKPADRDWLKKFTALMEAKAKLKPVYGRFRLAPELAGATPEWLNAYVMRALLHALPDQAENLLGLREILFTAGDNAARWPVFSGETVFLLKAWDTDKLLSALEKHFSCIGDTATAGSPTAVTDRRYSNPLVGGVINPAKTTQPTENAGLEAPPTKSAAGRETENIHWLGQVAPILGKDSTPVFQTLDIELRLPAGFFPDAAVVFQNWLRTRRIAFNLRRTDRGLSLQLDPKKKNFLSAALLEQVPEGILLRLTAGPAFDLAEFFATSGDPNLARQADVRITRLELKT